MILRMPEYCSKFICTADRCTDNCCIGWEIDIDEKSLEYYEGVEGDFGEKLKNNISGENPACFVLGKDERCPFLNENNLCEIYIKLGEDKLCDICTEHPRYYEWFDGVKEGGTGLGCEESARIILSQDKPFSYTETEIEYESCSDYDQELFHCLEKARSKIINYLQDRKNPFMQRLSDILRYAYDLQYRTDNGSYDVPEIIEKTGEMKLDIQKFCELFGSLEMLDKNRKKYINQCLQLFSKTGIDEKVFNDNCPDSERYLENIAVYFIWRHFMKGVFEGEFFSKVFFMAAGCVFIEFLAKCCYIEKGTTHLEDYVFIAKEFSKEIEYSEYNLEKVMDAAYEEGYFK